MSPEQQHEIVWPILFSTRATCDQFVEFWDRHYSDYDEDFYQRNRGKPLTPDRIRKWFEWKNGRPLSSSKKKSILRYSSRGERIAKNADDAAARAFLSRPGGAIWRILWAHLQHPREYPIYDQHAHRAMAFLRGWDKPEIPTTNPGKVDMYFREYRPFFRQFNGCSDRRVDRALWTFGRFVGSGYRGMLNQPKL